jgi:DNA-binding NtrC family response regulator
MNEVILIIEDDMDTRDAIAQYLSYEQYSIKMATLRDCGIKMIEGVAIVLMDYNMPGMPPKAFLRSLKTINPDCCVILMTANSFAKMKAQELKIEHYLEKPFQLETLGDEIKKCLRKPAATSSQTSPLPVP